MTKTRLPCLQLFLTKSNEHFSERTRSKSKLQAKISFVLRVPECMVRDPAEETEDKGFVYSSCQVNRVADEQSDNERNIRGGVAM